MAKLDDAANGKLVAEADLRVAPAPEVSPAGRTSDPSGAPPRKAASGLRIAAMLLRTAFIFILMVLIIRVSQPQNETIWTAYDTPGDLVRLWLGIGACIWLVWQLFEGPRDVHGYRTWVYLGIVAVPFALTCLVAFW